MENKKTTKRRIGAILIEDGVISQEQLSAAIDMQITVKKPLGEVLVSQGVINMVQLTSILGRQLKIPYMPILRYSCNSDVAKWVGRTFCLKYCLVPFDGDDKTLYVAVSNPIDLNPIDSLRILLKKRIFIFIATPDEINKLITVMYPKRSS